MTQPSHGLPIAGLSENPLPGPFATPPGAEMETSPEVRTLAAGQVRALLESSPAFHQLSGDTRDSMRRDLEKISTYAATLVHDDWHQSKILGQTPVVRERRIIEGPVEPVPPPRRRRAEIPGRAPEPKSAPTHAPAHTAGRPPLARAQAEGFVGEEGMTPVAAANVARITEDTLNAIAFPTFVADLIKGTFQAIVDASIQQMEAFGELLSNVAKTVDEFMRDNITDNNARDWLVSAYPQVIRLEITSEGPQLRPTANADDMDPPNFRRDLNLSEEVTGIDAETIEQTLVPAARRKLAQSRQQTLASMVLMGINRIVVTRGRIKAGMGFRIDTTDVTRAREAQKFDTKTEAQASYGWFLSPVSASVKTTVAYVSSSQKNSESEIDVSANLTGEIDLRFKSDVFPLERFADAGVISSIQANTPNPAANKPITGGPAQ